jgi:hypothetical protein
MTTKTYWLLPPDLNAPDPLELTAEEKQELVELFRDLDPEEVIEAARSVWGDWGLTELARLAREALQ